MHTHTRAETVAERVRYAHTNTHTGHRTVGAGQAVILVQAG